MRTILTFLFVAFTTQVVASDLATEIKAWNEKQVVISGKVYTRGGLDYWRYKDTQTGVSFDIEFALPPKDLRNVQSKCNLDKNDWKMCTIKGLAEIDTTREEIILMLYKIDELSQEN